MQDLSSFLQAHWHLSLAFFGVAFALFILEMLRLKTSAARITPLQLTQLVNHKHATIIDTRSADEYSKGHIAGAVSIPLSELKTNLKKIEKFKAKPLVLVCAKGQESLKLASQLKTQGYHVHVLGGGIQSWISAELPIVKN